MLPNMLEMHLKDLPKKYQTELLDWIDQHFAKASKFLPLASNYGLKQQFKFSDSINYHITEQIFHEAMLELGYESRSLGVGQYQYKIRRI